ncbi:hypothetical protein HDU98_006932 [Podochytrium sp. JEL0797]|nr:hypothetical protein HDU98_006932 [Podochytrium sp. JEL0797]
MRFSYRRFAAALLLGLLFYGVNRWSYHLNLQKEAAILQKYVASVLSSTKLLTSQSHVVKGSRGIVFTGPGRNVDMTIMTVGMLRAVGCTLPVEFAYLRNEFTQEQVDKLRKHNIIPRDFQTAEIESYDWGKEQLRLGAPKVNAILSSPFEQLIFFDPDVVPLKDPTYLFDTLTFAKYGAIFWPDFVSTRRNHPIWKLTQIPFEFEFEFETGQMVLDKSRIGVLRGMTVAQFFCRHARFYFQYFWGDKEAFRWGFKLTGTEYHLNRNQVVSVGVVVSSYQPFGGAPLIHDSPNIRGSGEIDSIYRHLETNRGAISFWSGGKYCGQDMLQMDFNDDPDVLRMDLKGDTGKGSVAEGYEPTPLFLHANGIKHFYHDNVPPFAVGQMYVVPKGKTLTDLGVGGYTWIGRNYNVTPRDFLTTEIESYDWGKEQLRLGAPKVDAILSSPFEQLIFLDPDVMALRDPSFLFETKTFQNVGALFWPDFAPTPSNSKIWDLTQLQFKNEFEFESGQIVLDKSRPSIIRGLTVAQYFCQHAAVYFDYIWGDKDAFRWGFKLAGADYHLNQNQVVSVGVIVSSSHPRGNVPLVVESTNMPGTGEIDPINFHLETNKGDISFWSGNYCGQNMLQMDFDDFSAGANFEPTPLFLHANGIKRFYHDDVPPFQVAEMYVIPKGKTLTDLEVGGYKWIGRLKDQGHCGRLSKATGLEIAYIDFDKAYPGINERYMAARRAAMGSSL